MPQFSVLMLSHNKPQFCNEAIESVLAQTFQDWELIIVDSGVLFSKNYFDNYDDRRIKVIKFNETNEIRNTKAIQSWCQNSAIRTGALHGDWICYLCDDDILYPNYLEVFNTYIKEHLEAEAMYASQDTGKVYNDGRVEITGERLAEVISGDYAKANLGEGSGLDCRVDGGQLCHKRSLLGKMIGDEWFSESLETQSHNDGIFLERIGGMAVIWPINTKTSCNRRTPLSTYVKSE